jgi:diacylglycerol O-acyltransferase / wax synthase
VAPYTRRRLLDVPFGLDHPYRIEDPAFDPEFHERFVAVPALGTDRQLEEIVSRIVSRPLDRSHPLWEVYLIEGVDQGRKFVLIRRPTTTPSMERRRPTGNGNDADDP